MSPLPTQKGARQLSQTVRREQVQRLLLMGLNSIEICQRLRREGIIISLRTVKRDVAAVRSELAEQVQKLKVHSLKRAFAELEMLWRETCTICFSSGPNHLVKRRKDFVEESIHPAFWRLRVMDRLIKLAEVKAKLTGLFEEQPLVPGAVAGQLSEAERARVIGEFTNMLPAQLRNDLLTYA